MGLAGSDWVWLGLAWSGWLWLGLGVWLGLAVAHWRARSNATIYRPMFFKVGNIKEFVVTTGGHFL